MSPLTAIALALAAPVPPAAEVTVEVRGQFPKDIEPLALSPAGDAFLARRFSPAAGARSGRPAVFVLTDKDGGNPRDLFRSPVDDDDVHRMAADRPFSPDGKRVVVMTTADGKPLGGRPGVLRAAVVGADGRPTVLPADGVVLGAAFAGEKVAYVDAAAEPGPGVPPAGFKVKVWDGTRAETAYADPRAGAAFLSVSPDGAKVAVFAHDGPMFTGPDRRPPAFRVRVVDLKTGKAADSEPVTEVWIQSGLAWVADGGGLVFEKADDGRPGRPRPTRVDVGPLRPYPFGPPGARRLERFDPAHLRADWHDVERENSSERFRQEVVRVADGKRFAVPAGWEIRWRAGPGGLGVVTDRKAGTYHSAIIRLPGERASE